MNGLRAALAASGLCMISSPGAAQDRWERQVSTRLAQAAALVGESFRPGGIAGRGALNTGETASFLVSLTAGLPAVLAGVCDDDCVQLDLSLIANGYETDASRGGGNAPIVRVAPAAPTTYRVTVRMAECRVNPCWFGIGLFRQTPADRQ